MNAEILSVGTELLLGEIIDTNAAYLAQQLSPLGINLFWVSAVGDNLGRLTEAFQRAWNRSDLIITTGGLGPTDDDLTREAIADMLGEKMTVQPDLLEHIQDFFRKRGSTMAPRNRKQATLIPSAEALPNPIGTAPGWWVHRDGHIIVSMPGVPVEMRRMWQEQVLPRLRPYTGGTIVTRTLKVYGLGESAVEELVQEYTASANPTLATYAKDDGVHLRLGAKAADQAAAREMIDQIEARIRGILGPAIYGIEPETLSGVVGRLLAARGETLATMESCTGGYLANELTNPPGSSHYFLGGMVAYTRQAKVHWGVDPTVLDRFGLVSRETATAMAETARRQLGTTYGIGITGVAGPEGHGGEPPGVVHIALAGGGESHVHSTRTSTTRERVKMLASLTGLNMLRLRLLGVAEE